MLQVVQHRKSGVLSVAELPAPSLRGGGVLVLTKASMISSGTERASVEMSQASMLGKAQKQPHMVKQALDIAKREGVLATYKKIQTKLNSFKELGYSSAGIVLESSVTGFVPGDLVACTGGSGTGEFGTHAEMVFVPQNLVARIPEGVSFEEAAFTTLGSIALQGVRQAELRLGEYAAVVGLGLLGLITVQLLKANGCHVIGMDVTDVNFELAAKLGCDQCVLSNGDAVQAVESFTHGYGTDAVLLTAATKSNEPMELAMEFARPKSKVIVVGDVGLTIPRPPFFTKEIDVRISCSTGPGRFDAEYEQKGIDYPVGYVRWTEKRNSEAILNLIAQKKLNVADLITHNFPIAEATKAYDLITGKIQERYLGVVITYPERPASVRSVKTIHDHAHLTSAQDGVVVGFIGAGMFAEQHLVPHLRSFGARLRGVANSRPVSAMSAGKKFGFEFHSTDTGEVFRDPSINTVFIATRHDSHARYVVDALKHRKHVFVEKPLTVTEEQLDQVRETYREASAHYSPALMVGFNRRFSTPFSDMKAFFRGRNEPFAITYRVNALKLPPGYWIYEENQGGRIIGEGCHFIDCMQFLTEARPTRVFATSLQSANVKEESSDTVSASISYSDGSVCTLIYTANGDSALPREYCEVYSGGRVAVMNNFREVSFYNGSRRRTKKYDGSMGHREEVQHFLDMITGKTKPTVSFESVCDTTLATIRIMESLVTGQAQDIVVL